MALRGEAGAGGEAVPVAGMAVGRPDAQHVLGGPGAEDLALVVGVAQEFGGVEGVACDQLQIAQHLAAHLGFQALAADLAGCRGAVPAVALKAGCHVVDGTVLVVVAEHRERGVEALVHQLAFDAEFVVRSDDGLQHLARRRAC